MPAYRTMFEFPSMHNLYTLLSEAKHPGLTIDHPGFSSLRSRTVPVGGVASPPVSGSGSLVLGGGDVSVGVPGAGAVVGSGAGAGAAAGGGSAGAAAGGARAGDVALGSP